MTASRKKPEPFPHSFWRKTKEFGQLVNQARQEFSLDNCTKLSAALSYYTLFSLAPMLLIVIAVSSIWLGREAVEGYLYPQFSGLIGKDAAAQLQEMISRVKISGDTPWVTVIGAVTLFMGATGVFLEIQDSINLIWSIKAKPKRGWVRYITNRLLSFSLVVGLGFLLLVSLVLSAVLNVLNERIEVWLGSSTWMAFFLGNLISLAAVLLLFAVVFKVLPDATVKWRDVLIGALFTAVLFLIGKYLINLYLSRSSTVSAYGAAGAVVLIILWVYYSALILYFGAEFTKVFSNKYGGRITPNSYAVFIERKEVKSSEPVLAVEQKRVMKTEKAKT